MSEVYNDKDTNYDYEELFDDEMDNEELDDEYEENPENMTLKEKAEAEGMSVREYISEVSFRRGPVGVISGIGFGIIGVIGQAVHVLIKAIVFGEHEKADLWNAFKKYYALSNNKNLDGDTKEESEIPCDYDGVMGVPITFMDKYNPLDFEIIGADEAEGTGFSNGLYIQGSKYKQCYMNGKRIYKRIFIRKKVGT